VKEWLGLSMASLIAFFAGLGCLLAAITVGAIYSVQNLADFQAIQSWRIQWLLAALAAFVAGILLKQAGAKEK
jgi:MFS family permease